MIRYSRLGYVALNVTDLARSRAFYEEKVGLEYAGTSTYGSVRFRCSEDPYAVELHQGPVAGHKRTGWMLEGEDQFENLHRRLRDEGVAYQELGEAECADRQLGRATRMVEPYTRSTQEFYILPPGTRPRPWNPTLAKIQRLGHVAYWTPQKDEAVDFFGRVLNFAHSDSIGEVVSFFRCWPNPYHHGVGIARAKRIGFHHLNFMVTEIDDVGAGLIRLKRDNVPIMKGLGRHPASGSVFLYYLDPDGLTLEYSFGMEEFPEHDARAGKVLPLVPESQDSWLGPTDPRHAQTGEVEYI